jgi:GAF domain-containing protein
VHIDDAGLAEALGRLNQQEVHRMPVGEALHVVVDAMPGLFSVDGAGILMLDAHQDLRHVASTDESAQILEAVQEATGKGPCVAALVGDQVVEVEDIGADVRWPQLSPILVENGIRGILGVPIHVTGTPVGSLNVYHREKHGWDRSDIQAIVEFDRIVERLLSQAVLSARDEALVSQLEQALEARITIDRAVGMLMGIDDLDPADAFERIRRAARSARRPVREVASEVLATRKLA